jgi:hypothetical protein
MEPTNEDWRQHERRRGGYTIWKEIIGTAAVVVPVALIFAGWLTGIDKQTAANTIEIGHLREQRSEITLQIRELRDEQRAAAEKLDTKLDIIRREIRGR